MYHLEISTEQLREGAVGLLLLEVIPDRRPVLSDLARQHFPVQVATVVSRHFWLLLIKECLNTGLVTLRLPGATGLRGNKVYVPIVGGRVCGRAFAVHGSLGQIEASCGTGTPGRRINLRPILRRAVRKTATPHAWKNLSATISRCSDQRRNDCGHFLAWFAESTFGDNMASTGAKQAMHAYLEKALNTVIAPLLADLHDRERALALECLEGEYLGPNSQGAELAGGVDPKNVVTSVRVQWNRWEATRAYPFLRAYVIVETDGSLQPAFQSCPINPRETWLGLDAGAISDLLSAVDVGDPLEDGIQRHLCIPPWICTYLQTAPLSAMGPYGAAFDHLISDLKLYRPTSAPKSDHLSKQSVLLREEWDESHTTLLSFAQRSSVKSSSRRLSSFIREPKKALQVIDYILGVERIADWMYQSNADALPAGLDVLTGKMDIEVLWKQSEKWIRAQTITARRLARMNAPQVLIGPMLWHPRPHGELPKVTTVARYQIVRLELLDEVVSEAVHMKNCLSRPYDFLLPWTALFSIRQDKMSVGTLEIAISRGSDDRPRWTVSRMEARGSDVPSAAMQDAIRSFVSALGEPVDDGVCFGAEREHYISARQSMLPVRHRQKAASVTRTGIFLSALSTMGPAAIYRYLPALKVPHFNGVLYEAAKALACDPRPVEPELFQHSARAAISLEGFRSAVVWQMLKSRAQ